MSKLSDKTDAAQSLLPRFQGVFPAIPTPFDHADNVDHPALRRLVNHLLDGGVHGIWALGSGGEFPSLTEAQRRATLRTIVDETNGRAPVMAGISGCCAPDVEASAADAADAGADGVFAIAPFYFRLNLDDICLFFERIASASALPVIVYHNSHNSGIRLTVDAVKRLSGHPNIIGLKDAGCDFALFQAFMTAFEGREDFVVFQGDDTAMASAFLLGCRGTVAALPVVAPRMIVELFDAGRAGDIQRAHELQRQGMDLFKIYEVTGSFDDSAFLTVQKAALEILGLCTRRPAPPSAPLDDRFIPTIQTILRRHELIK